MHSPSPTLSATFFFMADLYATDRSVGAGWVKPPTSSSAPKQRWRWA